MARYTNAGNRNQVLVGAKISATSTIGAELRDLKERVTNLSNHSLIKSLGLTEVEAANLRSTLINLGAKLDSEIGLMKRLNTQYRAIRTS